MTTPTPAPTAATDGRRARGDATRRRVAREASMIATVSGLDSITVGGLSERTGVSKSGILTVFGSREAIQVAAVAEARRIYREVVIAPVWDQEPGAPRLRALLESWVDYLRAGVFPGGCFIAATAVEYGHRTGPVAEAVRRLKREWLDLLEADLVTAGSASPEDDAFRIDAYLTAGNTQDQLAGDETWAGTDRAVRLALAVIPD
ncbi:TetR/AcrR family transcriptional regulator [Nocardioides silvaticus]|uniref:TetR/AcrR family transcriptional regulator n=1 Tax=Nocardioides silvaticus TaxID=2201891 RepID=A0A316TGA2_9ACTN|nr:TetR/AcrR family transcriptional regulator [Nocardioides silvaticus]PWN02511.1 TetR/AcrR family transcriptional regulator [Nocardioides silvaticus]